MLRKQAFFLLIVNRFDFNQMKTEFESCRFDHPSFARSLQEESNSVVSFYWQLMSSHYVCEMEIATQLPRHSLI